MSFQTKRRLGALMMVIGVPLMLASAAVGWGFGAVVFGFAVVLGFALVTDSPERPANRRRRHP